MLSAIRWAVFRLIDGNIDDFQKLTFDGAHPNETVVPVRSVVYSATYGKGHVTRIVCDTGETFEITVQQVSE